MPPHLHKRLSEAQVKAILDNYVAGEITVASALENLGVQRSRFFTLLNTYRHQPDGFSITPPKRANTHRRISPRTEALIIQELQKEKQLIENPDMPVTSYNYSAVRDDVRKRHHLKVSVPTIIHRAKAGGFYLPKRAQKIHDREVITNFAGELVQHDSSWHLWSPFATEKWHLITSLDDYSRSLLFAELFERESSWVHITSIESVVLRYGCPLKYYPDQHSIFRYVRERDKFTPWQTAQKFTGEVETQFQQVLKDCGTDLVYALSPQAKGKVERPYRWLQDRIVRTCAKEHITKLEDARKILKELVYQYNYRWVHSTTKEIPMHRLETAIQEGKSLFRPFTIKPPYQSSKDIFCLRSQRVVNAYRKITFKQAELRVPKAVPRQTVHLRVVPNVKKGLAEVRMWHENKLLSVQLAKHEDLGLHI
ncbi:MAG: hypothetical protein Q8O25_09310 [Sulfurisoma sp.]|nr:hypothetical protein [Sulfurisoma sp.]